MIDLCAQFVNFWSGHPTGNFLTNMVLYMCVKINKLQEHRSGIHHFAESHFKRSCKKQKSNLMLFSVNMLEVCYIKYNFYTFLTRALLRISFHIWLMQLLISTNSLWRYWLVIQFFFSSWWCSTSWVALSWCHIPWRVTQNQLKRFWFFFRALLLLKLMVVLVVLLLLFNQCTIKLFLSATQCVYVCVRSFADKCVVEVVYLPFLLV